MNRDSYARDLPLVPLDLHALGEAIEAELRAAGRWDESDTEPTSPERDAAHEAIFVAMAHAAARLDAASRQHVATAPAPRQRQRARVRRAVTRPRVSTSSSGDGEPPRARRVWIDPLDFRGVGVDVEVVS